MRWRHEGSVKPACADMVIHISYSYSMIAWLSNRRNMKMGSHSPILLVHRERLLNIIAIISPHPERKINEIMLTTHIGEMQVDIFYIYLWLYIIDIDILAFSGSGARVDWMALTINIFHTSLYP